MPFCRPAASPLPCFASWTTSWQPGFPGGPSACLAYFPTQLSSLLCAHATQYRIHVCLICMIITIYAQVHLKSGDAVRTLETFRGRFEAVEGLEGQLAVSCLSMCASNNTRKSGTVTVLYQYRRTTMLRDLINQKPTFDIRRN